jgi:hypothetical protein
MEVTINEAAETSIQAAQIIHSTNPFNTNLVGEERAFKVTATGILFPFSRPEEWEHLIGQGAIVKVKDEQAKALKGRVNEFIASDNMEGLRDFLNEALKPNLIESAIKEVKLARDKAEAQSSQSGKKVAPKYPDVVAEACHYLSTMQRMGTTAIAEKLGITYPTAKNGIDKISEEKGKQGKAEA